MRYLLLAAFIMLSATTGFAQAHQTPSVPFTSLTPLGCKGENGFARWLNSQNDLQQVWERGTAPSVDFRQNRVLLIQTGYRRGGIGYYLLEAIHLDSTVLIPNYNFTSTATSGMHGLSLHCNANIVMLPATVSATRWQNPDSGSVLPISPR